MKNIDFFEDKLSSIFLKEENGVRKVISPKEQINWLDSSIDADFTDKKCCVLFASNPTNNYSVLSAFKFASELESKNKSVKIVNLWNYTIYLDYIRERKAETEKRRFDCLILNSVLPLTTHQRLQLVSDFIMANKNLIILTCSGHEPIVLRNKLGLNFNAMIYWKDEDNNLGGHV